jgi:hypothetical protein
VSNPPLTPLIAPSVPILPGQAPAGMIPAEAAILTKWLNANRASFDSAVFNTRVGHGTDPGPAFPDYVRQAAILNSQRRVDCILQKGNLLTIVEVKVRATLQAIGQLEGYRVLWLRDNPGASAPALLLLAATIDDDTAYVYGIVTIPFVIVPQAG